LLLYKIKTPQLKMDEDVLKDFKDFFSCATSALPTSNFTFERKSIPFVLSDYEDASLSLPISGVRSLQEEQHCLKFIDFYRKIPPKDKNLLGRVSFGVKVLGVEEGQYVTILGKMTGKGEKRVFEGKRMMESRRKEMERIEKEEEIVRNKIRVLENGFYMGCTLYITYIILSLN
jgi:hypothetical protein